MKIVITKELLEKHRACEDGYRWFLKKHDSKEVDLMTLLNYSIKKKFHLDWANWLITRVMTKEQCIRYAIYAAEQVLNNFEKKYPEDKRPRQAIEAAKNYLKNPTEKNKVAAYSAYRAADSAAYSAYSAYSAYRAAYSAADSAAYSAYSAYSAYRAAYSAADSAYRAAKIKLQIKILRYGIGLIK